MAAGRELARGVAASPGEAEGKVVVVQSVLELSKVQEGDILVVRESNPAWTVAMMNATGLISQFGGIICHAAIIAREMGIPCIVDVENATDLFRDGMQIKIDGTKGIVYEA